MSTPVHASSFDLGREVPDELPEYPSEPPPEFADEAPPPRYTVSARHLLDEFARKVPNRGHFNISFLEAGLTDFIAATQRNFSYRHDEVVHRLVITMERIFLAVNALLSVEWRAGHIDPYDAYSISFELNKRAPAPSWLATWLQKFIIIVQATSLRHVDPVPSSDSLRGTASTVLRNVLRRTSLPVFPLSERRHSSSSSGIETITATDTDLRMWDLTSRRERPGHPVWIDRFTQSHSVYYTHPGEHPVWWQWAGSQAAVQNNSVYGMELEQKHVVGSACFPKAKETPALVLIFRGPAQLQPQGRPSGSRPPHVLAR